MIIVIFTVIIIFTIIIIVISFVLIIISVLTSAIGAALRNVSNYLSFIGTLMRYRALYGANHFDAFGNYDDDHHNYSDPT